MTVGAMLVIVLVLAACAQYLLRRFRPALASKVARIDRTAGRVAGGVIGVALIGGLVLFVLIVRSCSIEPDPFVVRVTDASDTRICLERVDDGPKDIDGCHDREFISDLPPTVTTGHCIELQVNEVGTVYVTYKNCPPDS